jgi:hypothetical protein
MPCEPDPEHFRCGKEVIPETLVFNVYPVPPMAKPRSFCASINLTLIP